MKTFTGLEYLYIDIANNFGLDKLSWEYRIDWAQAKADPSLTLLEDLVMGADDPVLYTKAVKVLRDTQAGKWTGFIMGLDATASGLQIMASLIGCWSTAQKVNLIDTGRRDDVYQRIADEMNMMPDVNVDRAKVKKPIMTVFYGSKAQPRQIFGEDTPELEAFYDTLKDHLPGAMELMADMQMCQDKSLSEFSWTMPDGHKVVYKTYVADDKTFRIPHLNDASYTYRHYRNAPDQANRSLAANIVHSIDGYIVREMLRRTHRMDIQMAAIHDSFWCHPNDMNVIRHHYKEIMADIADSNLMQDILREVTNNQGLRFQKYSHTLGAEIRKSEYALS